MNARFRVATWNVLFRDSMSRLPLVAKALRQVGPDVVLLQETNARHAAALAREIGLSVAVIPEHDEATADVHVPAILAAEVADARIIPLPSVDVQRQYAVLVRIPTASGDVTVCSVHLRATSGAGRMALASAPTADATWQLDGEIARTIDDRLLQLDALLEALDDQLPSRLVIGGDFNFVPDGREYRAVLRAGLVDAWRGGPRIGYQATILEQNPLVWEGIGRYREAANSRRPGISGPLDYTLDFQFHTASMVSVDAWIFGGPTPDAQWPSDHLGIAVDYR